MKINKYELNKHIKVNDLLEEGFEYSADRKYLTKVLPLKDEIVLWIKISLKNFKAEIDVLDDDYCQYYIPFYYYGENKIKGFEFLYQVIEKYNYEMDKLKCFKMNELRGVENGK